MAFTLLQVYKDYYPPVVGGIEKHVRLLADALKARCRVRVLVANRERKTAETVVDGIPVVRVGAWGRFLSAPVAPAFPWWIKRLDSDVIHFHLPNPTAVISHRIARPRGKVVVTYHSDIVRQRITGAAYSLILRSFLARSHAVVATSLAYAHSSPMLRSLSRACRVVPLGIDAKPWERNPRIDARLETILRDYPGPRVFFLGVHRYYKGLPHLLRAMRNVPARLYVGGEGPMRERWMDLTRELALGERVRFLGRLSDEDAAAWMHACDIFCLPAHLRSEAFGLCQIEAHLCGKPVVSTRLDTGVPFVNRDGETGLVVEPGNPDALADALRRLVEDDDLRERLGRQARERALREFTASTMIEKIWDVYSSVLGESEV